MTKYVRGSAPHLRRKIHAWVPLLPERPGNQGPAGIRLRGNKKACGTAGKYFGMTHKPEELTCKRCDKPEIRRRMRDAT